MHKLTLVFTILYIINVCKTDVPKILTSTPKNALKLNGRLHKENSNFNKNKKTLQEKVNEETDQLRHLNTKESSNLERQKADIQHLEREIKKNQDLMNDDIDNGNMDSFDQVKLKNDILEKKISLIQKRAFKYQLSFKTKSKNINESLHKHVEELNKMGNDHNKKVQHIRAGLKSLYIKHVKHEAKKIGEDNKLQEKKAINKIVTESIEKSVVKSALEPIENKVKEVEKDLSYDAELTKKVKNLEAEIKNTVVKRKIKEDKKLEIQDHSPMKTSLLNDSILKETQKLHIDQNLEGILGRLLKNQLITHSSQLKHWKKVRSEWADKRKAFKQNEENKKITEYLQEKSDKKALTLSHKKYQQYLTSCKNQVTTCINYCNKGHSFKRTVNKDHSASYECGDYDHPLKKCTAPKYLDMVKGLRTCGNSCIKEGRCITFFKNEYQGIYSQCKEMHTQCQRHFCPGEMLKGYLPCMMTCGGEICSDIFQSKFEADHYIKANDKFVHETEFIIKEDNQRPAPID